MSARYVLHVPEGATKDEIARWKTFNPEAVVLDIQPLAEGETVPPTLHRSAWSTIVMWLKPLLAVGATILVPGPLGAAVSGLVTRELDDVQRAIDGQPAKEQWTLSDIHAEVERLQDPRT